MKLNISMLLMCSMLLGCFPSPQPEPIVIERACFIDDLPPKQSLPPVHYASHWADGVEWLCLDPANQEAEKERELRLREDVRICRESYERAIERCTEE